MQNPAARIINLLLLSTCLLFVLLPSTTKARVQNWPVCYPGSNYTQGSVYESNLNKTLTSLVSNINPTGYYVISSGNDQDIVYGLLQCRGDISIKDCQFCVNTSSIEIVKQCPNRKEAAILGDYCNLHYADYRFFSLPTTSSVDVRYRAKSQNASDPVLFDTQLRDLMDNLSSRASSNPSRFATSQAGFIYALMQCARTLSEEDCMICLKDMIGYFPRNCGGKVGCDFRSATCSIRYENYSFFNSSLSPPPAPPPPPTAIQPPPPVADAPPPTTTINGEGKRTDPKIIIVATVISAMLLLVIAIYFLWRKLTQKRVDTDAHTNEKPFMFDLSTLRTATNNFSDSYKLGQGGFGSVYKGLLSDGRNIAVKRLSQKSGQGIKELKTEVVLVAKLLHTNLVNLLGFCLEEDEQLLVYEYLPNGSLDKILFDPSKNHLLRWNKRYNIITGIARGLLYLHEDSQLRIIHRDMKASNILLDGNMNAKISDFGLAKLFVGSQAQGMTNGRAGTRGYMAPEYTMYGHFSTKSDVYSFGILVLEIVAGRKNWSFQESMNLSSYAWQLWRDGTPFEIVDSTLGNEWLSNEVMKCIQIGLLCVQQDASNRPSMSEVLLLLNTDSVTYQVPSKTPAYFIERGKTEVDNSMVNESEISLILSSQQSINEVTITDLYPR